MAADTPTPLATVGQLTDGPLADLVTGYDTNGLTQLVLRATRECEGVVNRRLAPFTGHVEAVRASGVDPDEYGGQGSMPLDLPGTLGRSFAGAMGAGDLVRHVWLSEFAPRYPEMWAYNNVTITIVRSYGGNAVVPVTSIEGPEPDTGHVWFRLGTFLPIGSLIRVQYGGGYQTMPADLVSAGRFMAASIAVRELDPLATEKADALRNEAVAKLKSYEK